jgi:hypothetical protein
MSELSEETNEWLAPFIYTNWQVLKGGVSSLAGPTCLSGWLEPL